MRHGWSDWLRRPLAAAGVVILGGALLAATAGTAAAQGGPTVLSFSPGSGPVGTPLTITGTGFVKGDIVEFASTPASGAQAKGVRVNAASTQITTTVPAFAATGPIVVIDPTGLEGQSPMPFQVTEGGASLPAVQWPGLKVTFEGSGFTPNSRVIITLDSTPVTGAPTDGNGDFSVSWTVPKNKPAGPYTIGIENAQFNWSFKIASDWPQYSFSSQHTGADPFELFLTESRVAAGLKIGGPYSTSPVIGCCSQVIAEPVISGSRVFAMAVEKDINTSKLEVFNRTSRVFEWASNALGASTSAPAVDGSHVFVASTDQHVYAYPVSCSNPCSPTWTSAAAGGQFNGSSPAVFNGDVFVGNTDGRVYAYPETCSATCNPLWVSNATHGPIDGSPAVEPGRCSRPPGTAPSMPTASPAPTRARRPGPAIRPAGLSPGHRLWTTPRCSPSPPTASCTRFPRSAPSPRAPRPG